MQRSSVEEGVKDYSFPITKAYISQFSKSTKSNHTWVWSNPKNFSGVKAQS